MGQRAIVEGRTHHELEDVIVLVDESSVRRKAADEDKADDGQEDHLCKRQGEDAAEGKARDGSRDAHPAERRAEDHQA